MKYFYDHETDAISFTLADVALTESVIEVVPNVVVYLDGMRRPLAVNIRQASGVIDTVGLHPMDEQPMSVTEATMRMSASEPGLRLLEALSESEPFQGSLGRIRG